MAGILHANGLEKGQRLPLEDGDWRIIGTIPESATIQLGHGNIIADKTESGVEISTNGNITIGDVGYHNILKAGGDIQIGTASHKLEAIAGGAIKFDTLEDCNIAARTKLEGSSIQGKKTGQHSEVNATNGDIEIETVGYYNALKAAGDIRIGKAYNQLRAKADGAVEFGTVNGGDHGAPLKIEGSRVQGERVNEYAEITATNGDIRIERLGHRNVLNATGDIRIGTATDHLKAKAGGTIYYEEVGANHSFDSPKQSMRPWWMDVPPKPAPQPDTTVKDPIVVDRIVDAQRRAAEERGEGI